ncbi:MAG: aminotransferase class I/II-fold pyridoxal phosphate-dependent enzyme [Bacteroidota bacterium]|nr:aminotransferase class I/II-fold pyridoxal phosphate-dependent enzyme [Bacteroidota bacterium]
MKNKIWLSSPHLGGNEQKFVNEAFAENWIAPLGPNVNGFEEDLTKFSGAKHAAALSAGTAALHLAMIMLGVRAGDEVIASSFTFSASVNPITYLGAVPILIDSEPDTWNMSPELMEEAIKDRIAKGNMPKAIILVYLYGMPAKIEEIFNIAKRYNIPVIEDAAESLGSKYKGQMTGTFGKFGVYSFNGNKIITTSGGGALVSDSEEDISKARFLATQARDAAPHYQHSEVGYNYRMSNIVAGIGRGQMMVLPERVKQRRKVHEFYLDLFSHIPEVNVFHEPNDDFYSNHWLTAITINPNKKNITPKIIMDAMADENIECRPLWKPMHMQPIFENSPAYTNGLSEDLFRTGLCLPSGSNMSDNDLERITQVLNNVFS